MNQRLRALGNRSGKFRKLIDRNDLIAAYMDESFSEEELINMSAREIKLVDLKYGLIACSWHIAHEGVEYETAYALLVERRPVIQEEFDKILEELQTLLTIHNDNSN